MAMPESSIQVTSHQSLVTSHSRFLIPSPFLHRLIYLPHQLLGDRPEEILVGKADKADRFIRSFDKKPVCRFERTGFAAIERNTEILLPRRSGDFYGITAFQHDGETLQRMGTDGDHDHAVIARPHDRASAGKSVTGRPGRRRNDEPVRSIFLDQMPIDGKIQPCQLPDLVMPDDDIIQHARQPLLTAVFMFQDRV